MKTRHIPLILLLAGLLVFNLACSDDEENNITGNNNQTPTYDDPVLEALAVESSQVVQTLITDAPGWAQGNIGGKARGETPEFNEDCTCWQWQLEDGVEGGQSSWWRSWTFSLTYFLEDTPQREFAGSDRIQVEIGYNYYASQNQDEDNWSYVETIFDLPVNITQLGPTTIEINASGTGSLYGDIVQDGQHTPFSEQLTLMVYLTLDATVGCPAGSFDVDFGSQHFSIGFAGEPEGYWDYVTGPGQSQQGTLHFQCGP